ncbi:hypothetical protein J4438_02540 [Candidatus Woesearchaeota archaeon]|nr:hypothetical protein [Candidatus Woesearchaeota archaeon]
MKKSKSSNKKLVFLLFVIGFITFMFTASFFFKGDMLWGTILFFITLGVNILIFIKGNKSAVVFGTICLIVFLISSIATCLYGLSLTKSVSPEESDSILEENKEITDNLFESYNNKDYVSFSKDLSDGMKERYDKIYFDNFRSTFGKIVNKNCSGSKSNLMGNAVLCSSETEVAYVKWDIRIQNQSIYGLYHETIPLDLELEIKNKNITNKINVDTKEGSTILQTEEGEVLLVFDIKLKNKDEQVKLHRFEYKTEKYSFSQLIPTEGSLTCNNLFNLVLNPNEEIDGCVVFGITEGFEEGKIIIY